MLFLQILALNADDLFHKVFMKLILQHFEKNPTLAKLPLRMHNNLVILFFPMSLCVCLSLPRLPLPRLPTSIYGNISVRCCGGLTSPVPNRSPNLAPSVLSCPPPAKASHLLPQKPPLYPSPSSHPQNTVQPDSERSLINGT